MSENNMKKSVFERLNNSEDLRLEENMNRPHIEMWVDDDAAWRASHEAKKYGKRFTHFGVGHY